jgi:hypothetical protein
MKRLLVGFLMVLAVLAFCPTGASALEVVQASGKVTAAGYEYNDLSMADLDNLGVELTGKVDLVDLGIMKVGVLGRLATETGHGLDNAYSSADKTYGAYLRPGGKYAEYVELDIMRTEYGSGLHENRAVLQFGVGFSGF